MRYIYQDLTDQTVRLLRAYGTMSELKLPSTIAGKKLTEIGDYCFSAKEHLPKTAYTQEKRLTTADEYKVAGDEPGESMCCLCGNYLERVILPEGIVKIGAAAFYNCRQLERLELGTTATATASTAVNTAHTDHVRLELGSDVFVNCFSLCRLIVRSGVREASAAQQIVKLISSEIEVTFQKTDVEGVTIEAKVLFPEYFETYDEISPAHIFGRNIEGEGFRARTCFANDVIDLARYDEIFYKARNEESVDVLWHLIYDRLQFPVDLKSEARERYEDYLCKNIPAILTIVMQRRNLQQLQLLCAGREVNLMGGQTACAGGQPQVKSYLAPPELDAAIVQAAELDWTEAGAYLMEQKHSLIHRKKTDRYAF